MYTSLLLNIGDASLIGYYSGQVQDMQHEQKNVYGAIEATHKLITTAD